TNGGNVTTANAWIGSSSTQGGTGTGAATVDGTGSTWTNTGKSFSLGEKVANNKLSISDGGAVTSGGFAIYDGSMLTVDVGKGSSLAVSGTLTTNGTMRLVAGAAAANGTYTPISAETWEGTTGIVQALGGIWDAANHTVTVSDAELALAGRTKTIDTSVTQRLLVIDAATAQIAGASFLGTETSSTISFSASLLGNDERYLLESTVDADQQYLGGWDFTADGYTDGDPIYLSLGVGSGYSLGDLNVWHFDGTSWNMFDATDLAYDNTYASFTVNDLSSYAVTGSAPVPIPAAAWLLGSGLMGLFGLRRRMQT
ncbi:MAG: VPLPA-CTERM sorting domain-containing protein, partial [Geobacteraceae bacterium]|nr:VPLPA-CTERM sorting domain-containing protein [Geobacteraceae bacterium]